MENIIQLSECIKISASDEFEAFEDIQIQIQIDNCLGYFKQLPVDSDFGGIRIEEVFKRVNEILIIEEKAVLYSNNKFSPLCTFSFNELLSVEGFYDSELELNIDSDQYEIESFLVKYIFGRFGAYYDRLFDALPATMGDWEEIINQEEDIKFLMVLRNEFWRRKYVNEESTLDYLALIKRLDYQIDYLRVPNHLGEIEKPSEDNSGLSSSETIKRVEASDDGDPVPALVESSKIPEKLTCYHVALLAIYEGIPISKLGLKEISKKYGLNVSGIYTRALGYYQIKGRRGGSVVTKRNNLNRIKRILPLIQNAEGKKDAENDIIELKKT